MWPRSWTQCHAAGIVRTSPLAIGDWSFCRRSSCSQCAACKGLVVDGGTVASSGQELRKLYSRQPRMQLATLLSATLRPTNTHKLLLKIFCPANRRIRDILLIRRVSQAENFVCWIVCVSGLLAGLLVTLPRIAFLAAKLAWALCSNPFPGNTPSIWPGFVAAVRRHWLVRPSAVATAIRLDFSGSPPQLANEASFRPLVAATREF